MSDRSALTLPLFASLLLHLGVGALGTRWSFDTNRSNRTEANSLAPDPPPEDPPAIEPDPLRLGLNDSTATTLTWLGFDEYQEHIARQSEVDQPELTMDPPTGPPTESLASTPPPPGRGSGVSRGGGTPHAPIAPAEPTAEESNPTEPNPSPKDAEEPGKSPASTPPPPGRGSGVSRGGGTPDAPIAPTEPTEPAGSAATGQQSDRESVASSILTAEWKKLGQPLAAQGLEIKTRRPKLTQYTRIMGAARNPIVRVHFRRDGRVERVDLVQSSGNADVDRPIIDAIYLWRAAGEPLNRIPTPSPPATHPVEFRILM